MNGSAIRQIGQSPRVVVRFRVDRFDAFAERLGHDSNVQKARVIGCSIATMSRVRTGRQNPGPVLIAAVYAAASRHSADGAQFFDFTGTGA